MKAFELRCNEFNFQDDMEAIISYLSLKGHIDTELNILSADSSLFYRENI